jgi:hypothetical protein
VICFVIEQKVICEVLKQTYETGEDLDISPFARKVNYIRILALCEISTKQTVSPILGEKLKKLRLRRPRNKNQKLRSSKRGQRNTLPKIIVVQSERENNDNVSIHE